MFFERKGIPLAGIEDISDNVRVIVNADFHVTSEAMIFTSYQSQEWKSSPNRPTSDQNISIYGCPLIISCTLFIVDR